ncbi:MAG: DUF4416 family protein [Candidatus Eisenbacteria bacterium]|nr:DUF4416 family protein [Candidatus Eisenbacteria bacterium]
MSEMIAPQPVLRICSCLTGYPSLLPLVEDALVHHFGQIGLKSDPFPFADTDYYEAEMGTDLHRTWFCFNKLFNPEELPKYRSLTGLIEDEFAVEKRRRVNLDTGYLDMGKLVLASLKGAADKIYMGQGVWAHTCLRYRFNKFSGPDHSFPDFIDGRFNDFFIEARRVYKRSLKTGLSP